uniref:Uncharacterized protein n=1 Tax=Corethron hystrix TaxID=216773 RepID=A0A7S1FXD4_9STRA|mmetsp:Transcript_3958/g.7557  ORF Transcript_3958/g.7557 Transcript_3958/m.7557 type:complete len:221 (+) Transcript_3958:73-735(+)
MSGIKMLTQTLLALSKYHPVVIEGMGNYDPRPATTVASNVHSHLRRHWSTRPPDPRPKLIITQGDPLAARGISAITPAVAALMRVDRGLVVLDPSIADYHTRDADRDGVVLEMRYSELAAALEEGRGAGTVRDIEAAVEKSIEAKNSRRKHLGKPPLKEYFRDFALLQEASVSFGAPEEGLANLPTGPNLDFVIVSVSLANHSLLLAHYRTRRRPKRHVC